MYFFAFLQYILRLTPSDEDDDRKVIEFQCDTVKETQQWIDALVLAIRHGNSAASMEKNNITNISSNGSTISSNRSAVGGGPAGKIVNDDDTASVTSYTTTARGQGSK